MNNINKSFNQQDTQPIQREPYPSPAEQNNEDFIQPVVISNSRAPIQRTPLPKKNKKKPGCCVWGVILPVLFIVLVYFLFPARTNILLLGIDRAPEGTDVSRTDTNILISIIPLQPVVNMLSIPRDLWVQIPDVGENRINTAHFFAEAEQAGSGPNAAMQTVRQNFGVTINFYARVRFDGVKDIIDAMDGITIQLDQPMSGYNGGTHRLNGEQALAFARDRQGSDDFFRMQRGQIIIRSTINELLKPSSWVKFPKIIRVMNQVVDSNIPGFLYPRLGLALTRAAISNNINSVTINREMVTPFTTDQGANVLLPNWEVINPTLLELMGE
jgi:LCP family protein required for cell wall assembly